MRAMVLDALAARPKEFIDSDYHQSEAGGAMTPSWTRSSGVLKRSVMEFIGGPRPKSPMQIEA